VKSEYHATFGLAKGSCRTILAAVLTFLTGVAPAGRICFLHPQPFKLRSSPAGKLLDLRAMPLIRKRTLPVR
jgi:hypothetical protein